MSGPSKVVVVTGGAQGIGKGIAKRLLGDGFAVVIADLDAEAGRETEAEYGSLGDIRYVETDTASEDDVREALQVGVDTWGRLDAVVNNAGIADPENSPIAELTLEAWNRIIRTNLTGYFLVAKHAAPHLRRLRGTMVNIASTRALMSEPNTEAYSASKGGVVALTHALAMSLAPQVRVNCISPGWIDVRSWQKSNERDASPLADRHHQQHPSGRVGRPEDIAALTAFLLSDDAAFITGQNVVADGGMTKKMIYSS